MAWFIDPTRSKFQKLSNGKVRKLFACGCAICDKCWFDPVLEECIYGGPYTGYTAADPEDEWPPNPSPPTNGHAP